jgi:hypothetical protein
MNRSSIVVAVSLAAGFAAAAIVLNTTQPDSVVVTPGAVPNHFDDSAGTEDRIRALEAAVSEERNARQLLEEQLLNIYAELERIETNDNATQTFDDAPGSTEAPDVTRTGQSRDEQRAASRRDSMLAAGLSADRVEHILRLEDELQYQAMQARFEARNSDAPQDPFDPGYNPEAMLRAEIGDADYEMYLAASGRSTSVPVGNVLASSPGARVGLRAGDEIVAYDGQRVFSGRDLMQQTMTGGEGSVVVDVMRDGTTLQVVLPRGPIGIEIGRFRRR